METAVSTMCRTL